MGAGEHFLLDILHELLDLALHLFHALAHLQDDRHAADVHPQIASQRQDELQPLQVFVRVKAGVALGARGLEQSLALIKAQRLGMDTIHLGYGGNHVGALRFPFSHRPPSVDFRAGQLFFLISPRQNSAELFSLPRHPTCGGYLWTKIMPLAWWKISLKRAKTARRATRMPLLT